MDLGLAGRSIVVTGGSSGIGFATARLLLDEGAIVTICGRSADRLATAEAELDSSQLVAVEADVLDAVAAEHVIATAVDHAGRLDGVAAVAGRGHHGSLLELDPSVVVDEVSDKLLSLLNVARPAVAHLRSSGGSIVGLTAPTGFEPSVTMGAVSAGRAALAERDPSAGARARTRRGPSERCRGRVDRHAAPATATRRHRVGPLVRRVAHGGSGTTQRPTRAGGHGR